MRWLLGLAVLAGALGAVTVMAAAFLLSGIIAAVFLDGRDLADVTGPLLACAALAVLRIPFAWASDALALLATTRLKARLRSDLTGHLVALGPAYMDRERTGEVTSVLVNGMGAIDAYVATYQPARLLAVAIPALVVLVILVLDPPTTLVLLFTGPILVLLLAIIGSRTGASSARRFAELRWLSAFFLDMLQGIGTLKTFGRGAEQVDTIRSISRQYGDTTMEVLRTAFQTSLVLEWGGAVAVALVAVEISLRLIDGSIAFDRALAVLIIVPEFFLPLRLLATRYHARTAGRTAAERMFAILDTPVTGRGRRPRASRLRSSRVDVGDDPHRPDGRHHLHGRDRHLSRSNDAGRRRHRPDHPGRREPGPGRCDRGGQVDPGAPAAPVHRADGRQHPGRATDRWRTSTYPPGEPTSRGCRSARTCSRARSPTTSASRCPRPTTQRSYAAATAAGLDDVVRSWPHGLDTPTGERGAWLSGGQRQRIALARAFLSDAPLVILDEVTSQLDPASEERIRAALARLARERTVLVVSHRMRLVTSVDRVVVLDAGRIVQSGSPAELAAVGGPYARILAMAHADEAVA